MNITDIMLYKVVFFHHLLLCFVNNSIDYMSTQDNKRYFWNETMTDRSNEFLSSSNKPSAIRSCFYVKSHKLKDIFYLIQRSNATLCFKRKTAIIKRNNYDIWVSLIDLNANYKFILKQPSNAACYICRKNKLIITKDRMQARAKSIPFPNRSPALHNELKDHVSLNANFIEIVVSLFLQQSQHFMEHIIALLCLSRQTNNNCSVHKQLKYVLNHFEKMSVTKSQLNKLYFNCSSPAQFQFHDNATFKCNSKYNNNDSFYLKTVRRFYQEKLLPQQSNNCLNGVCNLPSIPYGKYENAQENICAGDTIFVVCSKDYHVRGSYVDRVIVHCLQSGILSPHPVCEKTACHLPIIPNGKFEHPDAVIFGRQNVRFRCLPGYHVGGTYSTQVVVQCSLITGMLTMNLSCKKQTCDVSSLVGNENNATTNSSLVYAGSRVNFVCRNGFVVKGTLFSRVELYCLASGEFLPPAICQAVCYLPQVLHGMYMTNATILLGETAIILGETSIIVKCDEGFAAEEDPSSSTFEVTCNSSGHLTGSTCVENKLNIALLVLLILLIAAFLIIACLICKTMHHLNESDINFENRKRLKDIRLSAHKINSPFNPRTNLQENAEYELE